MAEYVFCQQTTGREWSLYQKFHRVPELARYGTRTKKIAPIAFSIRATIPSTIPAVAIPEPSILPECFIWFRATQPKTIASIEPMQQHSSPSMPETREAMAMPLPLPAVLAGTAIGCTVVDCGAAVSSELHRGHIIASAGICSAQYRHFLNCPPAPSPVSIDIPC
jgi:hypothetical protein